MVRAEGLHEHELGMWNIFNLVGQLGGVAMVIGLLRVPIACKMLFFIVVLQIRSFNLHSTSDNVNIYNLRILYDFLDYCLLNSMGFIILAQKFGSYWRFIVSSCGIEERSSLIICRCSKSRR